MSMTRGTEYPGGVVGGDLVSAGGVQMGGKNRALFAQARFAICKACSDVLQDGFACRLSPGCCFGRDRSKETFHCPRGKW